MTIKKFYISGFTFVLCFNFPVIAFAQTPTEPNLEGLSNSDAAAAVEQYNQSVAEYNKQIDSDYESAVQKYNETNAYNDYNSRKRKYNDYIYKTEVKKGIKSFYK